MKHKTDFLFESPGVILGWAEKGLESLFVKAKRTKDALLKNLDKKKRKQQQHKLHKKKLIQKGKDQDLDVLVATNKAEKGLLRGNKSTKSRLQELTKKKAQRENTIER